jgi:hypothetical protein
VIELGSELREAFLDMRLGRFGECMKSFMFWSAVIQELGSL